MRRTRETIEKVLRESCRHLRVELIARDVRVKSDVDGFIKLLETHFQSFSFQSILPDSSI